MSRMKYFLIPSDAYASLTYAVISDQKPFSLIFRSSESVRYSLRACSGVYLVTLNTKWGSCEGYGAISYSKNANLIHSFSHAYFSMPDAAFQYVSGISSSGL